MDFRAEISFTTRNPEIVYLTVVNIPLEPPETFLLYRAYYTVACE